jgi:hypothetical protein
MAVGQQSQVFRRFTSVPYKRASQSKRQTIFTLVPWGNYINNNICCKRSISAIAVVIKRTYDSVRKMITVLKGISRGKATNVTLKLRVFAVKTTRYNRRRFEHTRPVGNVSKKNISLFSSLGLGS